RSNPWLASLSRYAALRSEDVEQPFMAVRPTGCTRDEDEGVSASPRSDPPAVSPGSHPSNEDEIGSLPISSATSHAQRWEISCDPGKPGGRKRVSTRTNSCVSTLLYQACVDGESEPMWSACRVLDSSAGPRRAALPPGQLQAAGWGGGP